MGRSSLLIAYSCHAPCHKPYVQSVASVGWKLASHMIKPYWVEIETIGCESHSGWLGQGMQEGILEQMRALSPLLVLQNNRQGDLQAGPDRLVV